MEKQKREAREKNTGALAMPDVGELIVDLGIGLPKPPAMAVTNAAAFEMRGEKPTGGRTRPRARTHGEDDARDVPHQFNIRDKCNSHAEHEPVQKSQAGM
ncbi:Serine/threonine-protein kinase [Elasticomyces elasticus]